MGMGISSLRIFLAPTEKTAPVKIINSPSKANSIAFSNSIGCTPFETLNKTNYFSHSRGHVVINTDLPFLLLLLHYQK